MNLIGARQTIVDRLTEWFPDARTVEPHGGRFSERELPARLGKVPCLLVAVLGIEKYELVGRDRRGKTLSWVAYCLNRDAEGMARDEWGMQTVDRLTDRLPGQQWGLGERDCQPPIMETIRAATLYTGDIDKKRVALWAVSWSQRFNFPAEEV